MVGLANNQKTNRSSKKISDNFIEALRKTNNLPGQQEALEKRRQQQFFYQAEQLRREEKELYSHRERELKLEVQTLQKEIKEALKAGQKVKKEIELAIEQSTAEPGAYHLAFLARLKSFVLKLIDIRKNMEESAEWLAAWNQRSKKKGFFWATFASKKGGSKFLLSSEHYLTRSAG